MIRLLLFLFVMVVPVTGCDHGHDHDHGDGDAHDSDAGHAHSGSHGGDVVELSGHAGHLEIVQDRQAGKVTIYVLAEDGKTPMAGAKAPQLKLTSDEGPKVIETAPSGSGGATFSATDAALKAELKGRITVELNGKTYNPSIGHSH